MQVCRVHTVTKKLWVQTQYDYPPLFHAVLCRHQRRTGPGCNPGEQLHPGLGSLDTKNELHDLLLRFQRPTETSPSPALATWSSPFLAPVQPCPGSSLLPSPDPSKNKIKKQKKYTLFKINLEYSDANLNWCPWQIRKTDEHIQNKNNAFRNCFNKEITIEIHQAKQTINIQDVDRTSQHRVNTVMAVSFGEVCKGQEPVASPRGSGWVRTTPLMFRPLLRLAQIRWSFFLYIVGTPCMYIVNFTFHQQSKMVRTSHFFWAGDATDKSPQKLEPSIVLNKQGHLSLYYRAIISDFLWFLPHAIHSIIYSKTLLWQIWCIWCMLENNK